MGVVFFHFLDFIGCLPDGLRLARLFVIGFFVDWVCRLLQSPDFGLANSSSLGELRQNK
jgi:hypothetical protein